MWERLNPFSKTYVVKCPDGPRVIYKNVDDAFPLFIKSTQGNADIKADIKDLGKINMEGKYKSSIEGLLYQIDEQNNSLMISFRTIYVGFTTDPCNSSSFFQREIAKMNDQYNYMQSLTVKLRTLVNLIERSNGKPNSQITILFADIVNGFGKDPDLSVAIDEIRAAQEDMRKLIGEN